jgi:hypothetical protein
VPTGKPMTFFTVWARLRAMALPAALLAANT